MTTSLRAVLLATVSLLCAAVPASAAVPPLGDAVMSPNVEYLGSLKQDVGSERSAPASC